MNQYTGIYRRCELLFIRNELERFGLQPLEGKVLNFLRRGSCTQEDVCAHFDMDKGRIARNLSELEEERSLHQDFVRRIAENAMKYRHRQGGCTNDQ